MTMKYSKLIFLAASVLVLGACSSGKDTTGDSSDKQAASSTSTVKKQDAEKDKKSSQDTASESTDTKKEQNHEAKTLGNSCWLKVVEWVMRIQISLNFFQLEGDYNHYEIQEIITSKRSCFQPFSLFHEQQE